MKNKKRVCFYDIETTYLQARLWRCGEQRIRPDQLVEGRDQYDIICIAYAFNDSKAPKVLHWDLKKQNSKKMIEDFDKIVKGCDITIGKNSDRFDVKHINAQRWLKGVAPFPDWALVTDDVEKQLRKHFALPSYGLDYVSKILGLGGKTKMEFQDWIDIIEKKDKKAFDKMLKYCKKDVSDTRAIWNHIEKYVNQRFNMATFKGKNCCINCGSEQIEPAAMLCSGRSKYQRFHCNAHGGYAGRAVKKADGSFGKMG